MCQKCVILIDVRGLVDCQDNQLIGWKSELIHEFVMTFVTYIGCDLPARSGLASTLCRCHDDDISIVLIIKNPIVVESHIIIMSNARHQSQLKRTIRHQKWPGRPMGETMDAAHEFLSSEGHDVASGEKIQTRGRKEQQAALESLLQKGNKRQKVHIMATFV